MLDLIVLITNNIFLELTLIFTNSELYFRQGKVAGLNPVAGLLKIYKMGRYQSGQLGQTVNLMASAYAGSSPARPKCRCSSAARATVL